MYEPHTYLNMLLLGGIFATIVREGLCYDDAVGDNTNILRYSRENLIELQNRSLPTDTAANILQSIDFPPDILRNNNRKKRKRGKRGGIRARYRRRANRVPLPPVMFGNVRSLCNKTDELSACVRFCHEYRESGIITLTESWLKDEHPDPTLPNFTSFRNDRSNDVGKDRGGGLITFINDKWCNNINIKLRHCDSNIEILALGL